MADTLSLLFQLDADGRPAVAEFQRVRKAFATEIAALRKSVVQSFTLPPIKLPTTPATSTRGRSRQADEHIKDFRRIEAEAAKSAKVQEREQARLNRAVQALQRQRSAAIITGWRAEERAAVASFRAQERAAQQAARSIASAFRGIGPGLQSLGRTLTIGITAPLLALGAASLKSAKDIDANVNTLKAFTGSAEAAERRLAQLIKTSRETPGLTTRLGLTLDAQLRVAQTTQETIDRVLPAIGRLNAVQRLDDPSNFVRNLGQLVTQNFERSDLKELVGQSPVAGQIISELFNVDSPTNAKAIREAARKMGITSTDAFFTAFAAAAARNQALATVTESIATRFDKVVDRVQVALRPLGLAILNAIEPFIEPVSKFIERIGDAFNSLSEPVKTAIVVIGGLALVVGPLVFVLGSIATAIAGVVTAVGTIATVVAAVGLPAIAAAVGGIVVLIGEWIAILAALGLAWKTNFLNIRGLVTDAATVILDAFSRIKAVFEDAYLRILPTLQSITGKVLGVVTAFWDKFGRDIVNVVRGSFEVVLRILEATLRFFGNFVDLITKLIDGDFRGAFRAFARILVNAGDGFFQFFRAAGRAFVLGIKRLIDLVIEAAGRITEAAKTLAEKFINSLKTALIAGAPSVSSALVAMLALAVATIDPGTIIADFAKRFVAALRRAASEGITIPVNTVPQDNLQRIELNPDGSLKRKPSRGTATSEADKGADAETRRRIRLLELEAQRAEAIAGQRISAENIHFDQRRTSLRDFTNFQIKEEEAVFEKKKAVFAAERAEAEKLGKGRELALGEIRLKELQAELDFTDRRNQLLANQQREELEAAKAHRQALLNIQEQADDDELARLEDLQRQGAVTAFDIATRQAEIEKAARDRRRGELDTQLAEAGQNVEERQRILDEIKKFDDESAESVKRNERLKRIALQETADAYRDYALAIQEALESAAQATRDAAAVTLSRLNARVLLTQRQRIERQFALDAAQLQAEQRASDLRIENLEREAVAKAKAAGEYEQKVLEIQRTFNELRIAEENRFDQERRKMEEDRRAELERADPNSTRSLFGDAFADFVQVIRATAAEAGLAISNLQTILGGFGAAAAEHFAAASASAGNFISILLDGIDQINAGLGDMLQNWILTGETGSGALRKLLASTLAYYSRTFLIKALDNVGEGFSNLAKASAAAAAGNFFSAALYKHAAVQNFVSAAKYGIASAATAVAGRFAAGDSSRRDTASSAIRGGVGDAEPRNTTFNSGPGLVETSSQAAREGSGGFFGRVVQRIEQLQQQTLDLQRQQQLQGAQVAQTLTKLGTARPGDVVTMGAGDARQAIGVAVIDHSNADGEFNERLQRNLGFA